MSTLLDRVSEEIDAFIAQCPAFQDACDRVYGEADRDDDGKLSLDEVVAKLDVVFQDIEDVLIEAAIKVEKPSKAKIKELLNLADVNRDQSLDEQEFAKFYAQVLKLATFNSARGFLEKNGAGIIAGLASAVAIRTGKEKIEIPEDLKPLMPYVTPVISFGVGLLAKYGITIKKKVAAEKKLFRCETFKKPLD